MAGLKIMAEVTLTGRDLRSYYLANDGAWKHIDSRAGTTMIKIIVPDDELRMLYDALRKRLGYSLISEIDAVPVPSQAPPTVSEPHVQRDRKRPVFSKKACPHCGKMFKKLGLHIAAMHPEASS